MLCHRHVTLALTMHHRDRIPALVIICHLSSFVIICHYLPSLCIGFVMAETPKLYPASDDSVLSKMR
jgi:hypothetical protein